MAEAAPASLRIGYCQEAGIPKASKKNGNEDRISCATPTTVEEMSSSVLQGYVGVFDGHGGIDCANYVNENMIKMILQNFNSEDAWSKGEDVLKDVFHELDTEYCSIAEKAKEYSGACGTVVVVKDMEALVANIGDCRAVHCNSKGKVIKAINDHRTDSEQECKRISLAGGKVKNGRVCSLEPTRTFGDIDVKTQVGENVIISTPEVERFSFHGSKGDFIIVASDGLWDKVNNKTAAKHCKKVLSTKGNDPDLAARALCELAISSGSNDDVTIAVLLF